jgi:hypothetical protein
MTAEASYARTVAEKLGTEYWRKQTTRRGGWGQHVWLWPFAPQHLNDAKQDTAATTSKASNSGTGSPSQRFCFFVRLRYKGNYAPSEEL